MTKTLEVLDTDDRQLDETVMVTVKDGGGKDDGAQGASGRHPSQGRTEAKRGQDAESFGAEPQWHQGDLMAGHGQHDMAAIRSMPGVELERALPQVDERGKDLSTGELECDRWNGRRNLLDTCCLSDSENRPSSRGGSRRNRPRDSDRT